jgi:hypothetical protein
VALEPVSSTVTAVATAIWSSTPNSAVRRCLMCLAQGETHSVSSVVSARGRFSPDC